MSMILDRLNGLMRPWRASVRPHNELLRSTQAAGSERGSKQLASGAAIARDRVLWIDGIGGFLLVDRDEVVIGQAISNAQCDVGIVGDLSRHAGAIRRSGGDYVLQPLHLTRVNDQLVDRAVLLRNGDVIQFGQRVQLKFRKPNPLSATGRLDLISRSKFKPSVDGVLLLADTCIIGPSSSSHIRCNDWTTELLLLRQSAGWFFKSRIALEVNDQTLSGQFAVEPGLRIKGEDFSLSVE